MLIPSGRNLLCLALLFIPAACSGEESKPAQAGTSWAVDLQGLFEAPAALVDQQGKDIVTGRAGGHAVLCDWNGDGLNDILLGCHKSMNTTKAEILAILNVGEKSKPKFDWQNAQVIKTIGEDGGDLLESGCGCKSGGSFELFPTDWNGDGHLDLLVNTYRAPHGVTLFLNNGKSGDDRIFNKARLLWEIKAHGQGSGGGDWNKDGISDYIHPVSQFGWKAHLGVKSGQTFDLKENAFASRDWTMRGNDEYQKVRDSERWFKKTPYAWNFSGANGDDSKTIEVVAVMFSANYREVKNYAAKQCHINFYHLNTLKKSCEKKTTLAINAAAMTRLSIGDVNHDKCMDIIYTGGTFNKNGAGTKIFVMFGKIKNME